VGALLIRGLVVCFSACKVPLPWAQHGPFPDHLWAISLRDVEGLNVPVFDAYLIVDRTANSSPKTGALALLFDGPRDIPDQNRHKAEFEGAGSWEYADSRNIVAVAKRVGRFILKRDGERLSPLMSSSIAARDARPSDLGLGVSSPLTRTIRAFRTARE
jgi:hypothetical protein